MCTELIAIREKKTSKFTRAGRGMQKKYHDFLHLSLSTKKEE